VGTQTEGLFKLDAEGRPVLHIGVASAKTPGLSNPMINSLHEDRRGQLWIGTMDGLDLLQIRSGAIRHFLSDANDPHTLSGNRIRVIEPARNGALWIGTHSGLNRLVQSADGRVQIDRFLPHPDQDDISTTIYGILEDAGGDLWLSTNSGVLRFDPVRGNFRHFGSTDGLQHLEFNGGAQLRLSDGRLAFGGIRGLNLFDPTRIHDSRYAPNVVLTSARIGSATRNRVGLLAPAGLAFNQAEGILRLHFAALDHADPAATHYRYRLDGFDTGWIDAGHVPDATYTNLGAGRYVFRAQATNHDGVWGQTELRLPIRVIPPWWNSIAAWIGYALAAIVAGLLIGRALHRRRRRELAYTDELRRREEHLKMALWGSGDDFWDLDIPGHTLRRLNAESINDLGRGEQVSVTDWRNSVIHPEDLPEVEERMRQHILGHSAHFESEHRVRNAQGEWVKVLARGKVVEHDARGRATRVAGTARDITLMDHAERERRIASEVLNSMTEAVTVIDLDFRFISVNHAFSHMTGYSEDEVIGLPSSLLDSSQHPPQFYEQMRKSMRQTGRWRGEMWQRRKDDEEFLCSIEAVEVIEPGGKRGYFVAVLSDITETKRAEQELRYLANFDTLTGLPNRALLSERLARAIVRARRQDTLVGVLFLDLDRFKEINDSLGHTAGDRILKAVAARLQSIAGPSDTVSRLGGDEFTMVLEDLVSAEAAFEVARKLLASFAAPLVIDDRSEISITPSVGISLYPAHGLAPTDLLKHADSAMYQAKANGRNTYLVYTEAMETEARRRANLTAALRRALDRNEFQLLFQPRLSLTTGRITGVEALLRWHSEELGEVMPTAFIPIAEETGMILRIGEWVMREACRALAVWQANDLLDISIAINVSVLQLLRGNLPQLLTEVLETSGAPANRLELEITESMVMANAAETRSILNQLRQLGVSLAIDDFGTGYSSLVYLKQLPIDMLKIDKEFIDDLTRDPDDEAITTTIITMAHSLGLNVIAEGVESQVQLDFLRQHGCDEIQGYWLSPPLDDEQCQAFIHSWQHSRSVLPGVTAEQLQ
jgi:diguanylate cyclase (GGDEF)-like protein/PAS domain S-box-containing protein